jgi:mono/diheme cytochrome c family protein
VEIGEARDVTDAETLRHLYEQIGYASWHERAFETRGALVTQLQVRQEVRASPEPPVTPRDGRVPADASAARHRKLFDAYCAVCHGRNGRGRGLAFEALRTMTPDLTLLTQRNGGAFPRFDVERCICAQVRSHSASGTRDMPVWSGALAIDGAPGAAVHAQDIAEHVESLQRRSP